MTDHEREFPPEPEELTEALEPLDPEVREALRVQWRSITPYAIENARRLDEVTSVVKRILRVVTIALILIGIFLAGLGVSSVLLLKQNDDTLTKVQQGRHVSLGVTCATLSAVAQAGRIVISGSTKPPPPKQEAALEMLGFPPFSVRLKQARDEAKVYVASISDAVDKQIGRKGDGLVRSNGEINCDRLANLAALNGTKSSQLSSGQPMPNQSAKSKKSS